MKRLACAAAITAALTYIPVTGAAQEMLAGGSSSTAIHQEFAELAGAIVKIRTVADLEFERRDRVTGDAGQAKRPYSVDGTGVVVGQMMVDDRVEYLILTNHHVADASNYILAEGGYLRVNPSNTLAIPNVYEESYLIQEGWDAPSQSDIRLVEVVRHVRGDMTLMRTVHADRPLTVFRGAIGYEEGTIRPGDEIITSGYPNGGARVVEVGQVIDTARAHGLGIPHDDFAIDIRVAPGQSGSPVFRIEERELNEGTRLEFRLIGLVHARDEEANYVVPYHLWLDSLHEFPGVLEERLVR